MLSTLVVGTERSMLEQSWSIVLVGGRCTGWTREEHGRGKVKSEPGARWGEKYETEHNHSCRI